MKQNEQRSKDDWSRARYIAQRANTPYMKRTPPDWWTFPWEGLFEKWDIEKWREFNAYAEKLHGNKPN